MTQIEHRTAAWDWLLRLREEAVTQDDLTQWLRWYEADERHKQAFDEAQAFWHSSAQALEGPGALTIADLLNRATAPAPGALAPAPGALQPRAQSRSKLRFSVGIAACFLALVMAVVVFERPRPRPHASTSPPTLVEKSVLPDGSRLELAPRSQLELQFTPEERTVKIGDGEAYFSVAHNRARPFVVHVGSLKVRAVGTAFNVRKAASHVVVTVSEGTVEVSGAGSGSNLQRLTAGQQLTLIQGRGAQSVVEPADLPHALAWRQGRLEYQNEPLASVIADVNHYREHPVIVQDEAVGQILYSGTVFTAQTDVWVNALPRVFPVRLGTTENGAAILMPVK
ncbi:MAG: FecR domain-containing protein [Proteobacteria bacterium]|nr:FecR domain-containing protein [Pseudomonadota bacterium]